MPKPLNLTKKVNEIVNRVLDKNLLNEIGSFAAGRIQNRTRLGKGVSEQGGKLEKLKPLSDGYKKQRRKNKSKLSPDAKPAKSNLTFSGQMLESIDYKIEEPDTIVIRFDNNKARRKAIEVTDKGRPFFNLADSEINAIKKLIRDKIKKVTR